MNLASLSGRSAVGIPSICPRFFMLSFHSDSAVAFFLLATPGNSPV